MKEEQKVYDPKTAFGNDKLISAINNTVYVDRKDICATCGCSKHFHNKQGCQATWKMGTESCDCSKFINLLKE